MNHRRPRIRRQACAAGPHGALERETGDAHPHDAIFLLGPGAAADNGLTALARDGIVVRAPGVAAAPAGGLAQCAHYSTRVATRLRAQPPIHHYSVQIEQEIAAEARDPAGAYAVLQRA